MEEFREALEDCHLEDIGYAEHWFTWERGNLLETNIKERLERRTIRHLSHSFSDHCPLLFQTKLEKANRIRIGFRFKA
ncbi:putative Transposon TX1 [Gossypium australe]|uniref:Putative Transposon TX1 n=1 Tax=Gossypium australe TaxID=47621 RepID=A0A5B6WP49_9ROSI|nr:putative Transposon TX1 [Gossypium australe]